MSLYIAVRNDDIYDLAILVDICNIERPAQHQSSDFLFADIQTFRGR